MNNNKDDDLFGSEYTATGTKPPASKEKVLDTAVQLEPEIKRYGTGKPYRKTIRAKIIND